MCLSISRVRPTPLPIVIIFEINVLAKTINNTCIDGLWYLAQTRSDLYKDFLNFHPVQNGGRFGSFFAVTGVKRGLLFTDLNNVVLNNHKCYKTCITMVELITERD